MTEDMYNASDRKRVRELLKQEQRNLCAITGLPINDSQHILEHSHDNLYVRGVTSRQANSALGVIERLWIRYLSWWYPGTLSLFLRQCADYLEKDVDTRWRHDMWTTRLQTMFNTLKEKQKDSVLISLGYEKQPNGAARKTCFRKAILSRKFGYLQLKDLIEKEKLNV